MNHQVYILIRLNSIRNQAKGADGRIADFLLRNANEIGSINMQTIAEGSNCSYATVNRFFGKIGLSGLKELRHTLSEELKDGVGVGLLPDLQIEDMNTVSEEEIGNRICDYAAGVINSLKRVLERADFKRIITAMKQSDQIFFVGLGSSAVTAQYAYTKFFRLYSRCAFDTDIILAKMRASQLKKGSVLFAISSSGRTKSILELARLAHDNGATVISICDFTNSPLATLSDISVCTTVRDSNKYVDRDFPLIQGQITIVDVLYARLYREMPDTFSSRFKKTVDAVRSDKT